MQLFVTTLILSVLLMIGLYTEAAVPPPTPQVLVNPAKQTEISEQVNYPARIESKVNAQIYAEGDGVVTRIISPLGSKIKTGTKILVVKHTDPVYQYAPLALRSPVCGVVSQIQVTEGSTVTKGQLLAQVTDPKLVKVMIEVAAQDLPKIKSGQTGELTWSTSGNVQDGKSQVRVKGLSPSIDPLTGTATCELEILNSKSVPSPGTVGDVAFKVNKHAGFLIPESALAYRDNGTFLRVVESGKAKYVPVTLGSKNRGIVEVLTGLKTGDQVIERSSGFVANGEAVQVEK